MNKVYIDREIAYTGVNGDTNDVVSISMSDIVLDSDTPAVSLSLCGKESDVPLQDIYTLHQITGLFLNEVSFVADAIPGNNTYLNKWISSLKRFKIEE